MIDISSITVQLEGHTILENFSLKIEAGEKVALVGESGSGKSTVLKTLIGMYLPTSGHIAVTGLDLVSANLSAIRRQMFYLPQDLIPRGEETVSEYLRMPFRLAVNRELIFPELLMNELFSRMHLRHDLLGQPFYKLSGGERKRVGLMTGLLLGRSIILADEPATGVDADNRNAIAEILFANANVTVVAVTHDEALMAMADKCVELTVPTSFKKGR